MKFFLVIALLIPASVLAAPAATTIEGEDALRLWSAVKSESENDSQNFQSASLNIECKRAQAHCEISLKEQVEEKRVYLYRDHEARALYLALRLEEFESRLGFTKVFASIDSAFEILCSRFHGAEGESFSCSVEIGK